MGRAGASPLFSSGGLCIMRLVSVRNRPFFSELFRLSLRFQPKGEGGFLKETACGPPGRRFLEEKPFEVGGKLPI